MMRRVVKGLGLVLLAVVLVPALAAGGFLLWMRGEMPQVAGTVAVASPARPVQVLRDRNGVPHILAESAEDAYFALGYVHAQDRLWQMEMMRRAGAGRLAELFGTRLGDWALRLDRSMRTLGVHARAEASLANLAPETRRALDAYADGVNSYLETRREALPIEFQLLRHAPEPWRPADSVVWGKLMALQLSGNHREELLRARLLQVLPAERVAELFPAGPAGAPVTLAAGLEGLPFERALAELPPELGPDTASNEWVLAGSRTTTGKPILANDPHLGLDAPVLWYLARIVTPGLTIAGGTVPGIPMHPMGHNGRVAWGFTTTHSDTQDLFVERIDPRDPTRYLTPEGSEPFRVRAETIRVAGGPDEVLTVRETRHGPVISDLEGNDGAPPGHVLALAFTGLSDHDTTADALLRLNHARTGAEVVEALAAHVAPQQNVVYADTEGTIGFVAPGHVPIRKAGDGRAPVPGWTGAFDWTGLIPYAELPRAENPPSGQFVNANNAVVGPGYPHLIAVDWPEAHRARRIEEMLEGGPHAPDAVARQQMDSVSLPARALLPLMLTVKAGDGLAARAVERLRGWDGAMLRDRVEPLLFEAWLRALNRAVFADELGPLFGEYFQQRTRALELALAGATHWCDDTRTPETEACADALARSLAAAMASLEARHGGRMEDWTWGKEHVAPLAHPVLGRVPVAGALARLSVPTDGGGATVNRGTSRLSNEAAPFAHVHGAGLRAVYDLSDLGNSRFVIATGQSGNPLSPHWGDFADRWSRGGSVRLTGDRAALEAAGASTLTLAPRATGERRP